MSEKKKPIGGIWKRSGQYGDYLSGQIEINGQKFNFRAYENSYKKPGEKTPDFKIFPVVPKQLETKHAEPKQNAMDEDDIPF